MYLYIRVLQKYHYHHIAGNARTPGLSFQLEFIMLEHSKYYQKKTSLKIERLFGDTFATTINVQWFENWLFLNRLYWRWTRFSVENRTCLIWT